MFCANCGTKLLENKVYCANCGNKSAQAEKENKAKKLDEKLNAFNAKCDEICDQMDKNGKKFDATCDKLYLYLMIGMISILVLGCIITGIGWLFNLI